VDTGDDWARGPTGRIVRTVFLLDFIMLRPVHQAAGGRGETPSHTHKRSERGGRDDAQMHTTFMEPTQIYLNLSERREGGDRARG